MKLYTTKGIVFRCIKYGDSGIIVDIFTIDKGLRSYIVQGVRSKTSAKKAQYFQLFSMIEIVAYDGSEEKLCHIKEAQPFHHYLSLHSDVIKSSIGFFMIELARNTIKEREANSDLFYFLIDRFLLLDEWKYSAANFHIRFIIDLSAFLGFYPQQDDYEPSCSFDVKEGAFVKDHHINEYRLDHESSAAMHALMNCELKEIHALKITHTVRQSLIDGLLKYIEYHIEGFRPMKSLEVLRTVMG